jgi:two-component system OmpR family response regulator
MKILLIEDNADQAAFIVKAVKEHGHTIDHAADGHEGLMMATGGQYDVLVVDRMLPKLDGRTLLKTLREAGVKTPALFLTALGNIEDKVSGFDAGGDDYLVKPFVFAELYARLQSLARRPHVNETQTTSLTVADLQVDLLKRSVTRAGKEITLQPTEFRLLEYLIRHAGRIVTRTMLLEGVWDFHFDPKTNIVETHISRLRSKVDRGFERELIQTIRGAGYKIDAA